MFKKTDCVNEVLTWNSFDFHCTIGFLARYTQVIGFSGLQGCLAATAIPEFTPHVNEIGRKLGYVDGESMGLEVVDCSVTLRMVLFLCVVKGPLQFFSLPTIHGGEISQRVLLIDLLVIFLCVGGMYVLYENVTRRVPLDQCSAKLMLRQNAIQVRRQLATTPSIVQI